MPIYEYACEKCEREFEVEQRITDDPLKTCPKCRSRKIKRLISQTSFVLKGGGWYSDLYSSTDSKKNEKKDGGSEGKSESKSESKSDSKKESKGGSKDKSSKKGKSTKAA